MAGGGTIPPLDTNATYKVRMGSIEKEIKPSEMTNEWISYIGGKKVNHFFNRYFEKGTGNYREDDFSKDKPRAKCYGATIYTNNNISYLMGIYYNYDTKGMPNNWMLIYIQSDGQERGYYGGGKDENKQPDYSTVWTHYASPVDPLGRLKEY